PYASAVLRFQIRFPDIYPDLPPLVIFATDVFHPLIVPLTTYTFSTSSTSDHPVSASDEERLPPGGFSLRHGFPHWFGRTKRNGTTSGISSRNVSGNSARTIPAEEVRTSDIPVTQENDTNEAEVREQDAEDNEGKPRISSVPSGLQCAEPRKIVPVWEILHYIRSTFDDEDVLDSLPVEAAGNPGAWHAWKAHRRGGNRPGDLKRGCPQARLPGDWHWDGIWARRVQDEIEASHSDPIIFGNAARGGADEIIRFSRLDATTLTSVKELMESVVDVHNK
ncbi:hypothetical protein N7462_005998, partial [Penicillium macrosclerotiorum]|uniref:uncharacterized protein n=1 Tax=Penicillium macrosclerotiorum TaxID=303699 RepID=UPI002548C61C